MFPVGQPPHPPSNLFNRFSPPNGFRPPGGFPHQMPVSGSRGILQQLTGAQGFQGFQGFPGTQAFGAAGNAANSGAGWLNHMQTALKAFQSAAPMVQQYGPMLKNIPAMINMLKIMNEPDEDESLVDLDEELSSDHSDHEESSSNRSSSKGKKRHQGTSQPRLYV